MKKLQDLKKALNEACLERSDVIDGALTALAAREHMLIIGTPGSGKSMLSRLIAKATHGEYFETLFHPLMKPEEIFGPFSAKGMLEDKFVRKVDGYLPTADIAFGDEVFKASVSLRQTVLGILNERHYNNGGKTLACPLRTFFAASNELPTSPNDAAFFDRLALRFEVSQIQDDDNAILLFTGLPEVKIPDLSKADLAQIDQEVPQIKITKDVADLLVEIRREVANANIFVSDRKWRQAARLLQAAAYLNGKTEVEQDHFDILNAVIWNTPDERPRARKIIGKHGNPLGEKIFALQDAFAEIVRNMKLPKGDENHIEMAEGVTKMRGTMEKFSEMKKEHPKNEKVARAFEICKSDYNKYLTKHLGVK
jgi:MoxR-like ATPase